MLEGRIGNIANHQPGDKKHQRNEQNRHYALHIEAEHCKGNRGDRTGRGGRELRAYDVVLDTVDRVARQNGEPLDLRRREFDLLELLMRNRGAALYRDVIFERVWGELPDTESLRTVDTHIARLRKKLGWTDKQIETVFKIGYRLRKE